MLAPSTPNADCIPESRHYLVGYEEGPIPLPIVIKGVSKAVPVMSGNTKESAGEPIPAATRIFGLLQPMNNSSIYEPLEGIHFL